MTTKVVFGDEDSGSDTDDAHGTIIVANFVWTMPHGLNISEADFNPADWWFTDENGDPMEPEEVIWMNNNTALAQWSDPVLGTWRL